MRLPLGLIALFAAVLPAQDKASPYKFVPPDCFAVIRISGPAAWSKEFAGTQVAKLFTGPTLAPLVRQAGSAIDDALAAAKGRSALDLEAMRAALTGYSGDLLLALQFDWKNLPDAIDNQEPPDFSLLLVAGDDGHTDLQALVDQLVAQAERDHTKLRDLQIGGTRLRVVDADKVQVALPAVVDGCAVMLVSTDLKKNAPHFLDRAAGKNFEPPAALRHGALAMELDLAGACAAILDIASAKAEQAGAPFDVAKLVTDLGLMSLGKLGMSVAADGKFVATEFHLDLTDEPRGLVGVMIPTAPAAPKLLRMVPAAAEAFASMPIDAQAFYQTVAAVWDSLGEQVPVTREQGEKMFTEACKVRLKEDLLDLLGGELLALQDTTVADADTGRETPFAAMLAGVRGACFLVALRDGKAFADNIDKLLHARGLHAGRKTEEYQGAKVHTLKLLAAVSLEYAIADDTLLLTIGGGEVGPKSLRAALDAAAASHDGKPTELSAAVKDRLAPLARGWRGLAVTAMGATFENAVKTIDQMRNDGPLGDVPGLEVVIATLKKLRPELEQLGIACSVAATYFDGKHYTTHARW